MRSIKYIFAALTVIGIFLPWYSVSVMYAGGMTLNGFQSQSWGTLVLLASIAAVILNFSAAYKRYSFAAMLGAVLFSLIALASAPGGEFMGVTYGVSWGLVATLISAIVSSITMYKDRHLPPDKFN
jgi:hypothetical protein